MSTANIKCPECPYDKPRNLGTHLFFVHGYSKNRISEWRMNMKADTLSQARDLYDIFRCQFCPKTYKRQNSCRAHERVVHCVSSSMKQKCVPCPIRNCHFTTTALLDLCAHAHESHSKLGDFSIREARFENMAMFQSWRLQYEESTQTVLATESVNSSAAAGTTLRYLRCAQLEAQIRKVRNQMRQSIGHERGAPVGQDSEFEEEEDVQVDGDEEEEEEEHRRRVEQPTVTIVSPARRSYRKRKRAGDEEEAYGMEEVGYGGRGRMRGKERKEEKRREEKQQQAGGEAQEEEEIDVEQLDDNDETTASASSKQAQFSSSKTASSSSGGLAALAAAADSRRLHAAPPKEEREYEEDKEEERAPPRLTRASSAHLDEEDAALIVDDIDDDNDEEEGVSVRGGGGGASTSSRILAEEEGEKRNSRHCTAHMRVLVLRSGAVHVEYCDAHLGHDVIPIPPVARPTDRRVLGKQKVAPSIAIPQEVEAAIEAAKARRKGRRETEYRKNTERRMRTERDEFAQLCNRYDEVGANVELYEARDEYVDVDDDEDDDDIGGDEGDVQVEDEDELLVEEVEEEVIEEEVVDHEELVGDQ